MNAPTIVSPTKENINVLMLDSVSGHRFVQCCNLDLYKSYYDETYAIIDKIDSLNERCEHLITEMRNLIGYSTEKYFEKKKLSNYETRRKRTTH